MSAQAKAFRLPHLSPNDLIDPERVRIAEKQRALGLDYCATDEHAVGLVVTLVVDRLEAMNATLERIADALEGRR